MVRCGDALDLWKNTSQWSGCGVQKKEKNQWWLLEFETDEFNWLKVLLGLILVPPYANWIKNSIKVSLQWYPSGYPVISFSYCILSSALRTGPYVSRWWGITSLHIVSNVQDMKILNTMWSLIEDTLTNK